MPATCDHEQAACTRLAGSQSYGCKVCAGLLLLAGIITALKAEPTLPSAGPSTTFTSPCMPDDRRASSAPSMASVDASPAAALAAAGSPSCPIIWIFMRLVNAPPAAASSA